jgi:putative transposase
VKKKRFSEEQIIAVLKEAEAGAKVLDLCRKHGISDATFYNWKAKYAGMTVADAAVTTVWRWDQQEPTAA